MPPANPLFKPAPLQEDPQVAEHKRQIVAKQNEAFTQAQFAAITQEVGAVTERLIELVAKIATPDAQRIVEELRQLRTDLKPEPHDDSNIVQAVEALGTKIDNIPQAEPTEKVEVSNLDDLKTELLKAFGDVAKALRTQKAPQVSVAAPQVNLKAQDLKPLEKAIKALQDEVKNKPVPELNVPEQDDKAILKGLKAVQDAVEGISFPAMPSTPVDPLIRFTTADIDETDPHIRYYGQVSADGNWFIRKTDDTAGPKSVRYTSGTTGYSTSWTARATLTYGMWGA